MQKYLKEDFAVYLIQFRDGFGELWESFEEIIILGIDDIDERGALLVDGLNGELTPYRRFVNLYKNMKKAKESKGKEETFEVNVAKKVSIPGKIPRLELHKAKEKNITTNKEKDCKKDADLLLAMSLTSSWLVDSRKRVSWGDILWKTTRSMEDLPDRRGPMNMMQGISRKNGS